MKKYIALVSGLLVCAFLFPSIAKTKKSDNTPEGVPPVMYGFLHNVLELQPYLSNKERFSAPKNRDVIKSHLKDMATLSKELKSHRRLKTPGYEVPAKLIIQQLQEVNESYDQGYYAYAWRSLRSTLHNCSQCHSQAPEPGLVPQWDFRNYELPKDHFELGDFWLLIRSYPNAFKEFTKVVHGYGRDHRDQFKLRKALYSILTITLRIQKSPEDTLEFLKKIPNTKKLPMYVRDEIKLWKKELNRLKALPPMSVKNVDVTRFENLIEDLFRSVYPIPREGRSEIVVMEYASGLLSNYVNTRSKEVTQRMYFWLGASNIELDRFEITSFGDPYLKKMH